MYQAYVLPYQYDALEPFIDTHTMGLHYQKHYKGYLRKLNELLRKNQYTYQYPIELLSYHLDEFSKEDQADILFNLGGVLNHVIYFQSMSNRPNFPEGLLKNKILKQFGDFENFVKKFKECAAQVKGSGYAYLVIDQDKNLQILPMSNQDSPYFHRLLPLFCIDVWEHAYYINYENKRDLYIDNFFHIANFSFATRMYETFMKKDSIF